MNEKTYTVQESTLIAACFDGLIGFIFDDKEKFKEAIEFRLLMLLQGRDLSTERNKMIALYAQTIASYAGLDGIEDEIIKRFSLIGDNRFKPLRLDAMRHDENGLKAVTEAVIMPLMWGLGVDYKTEAMEMEALQNELYMR